MAKTTAPLTLDLIDEGRFLQDLERALVEIQAEIVAHVRKYGAAETIGAKAELLCKIALKFTGRGNDPTDFVIEATLTKTTPGRPKSVTTAMGDLDQTGQGRLFTWRSGSDKTDARQLRLGLNGEDSETIDQESGEVIDADRA